jgi:uncharacterized protein (DUF1330 family)
MPAYVFFDIFEIIDQKKMEEYGRRIGATVEQYGGQYLVRGGKLNVVEGDWHPVIPVIIEFPSLERAHEWYDSDEYKELRALRFGAAKLNAVLIEGVKY